MENRYIIIRDKYASIYVDLVLDGKPFYRMVRREEGDNALRIIELSDDIKDKINKHAPFKKRVTFFIPNVYLDTESSDILYNLIPEKRSILRNDEWVTISSTFDDKIHILISEDMYFLNIMKLDTQYEETDPHFIKSNTRFILENNLPLKNSVKFVDNDKLGIHYVKLNDDDTIDTSTIAVLVYSSLDNLTIQKDGKVVKKYDNLLTVSELNKKFQ